MAASKKDPTEPMRLKASRYPGVDQGTSCTQSSFKTGKQAFLYVGMQGGRCKAMFKLGRSRTEAERLAKRAPEDFQVGSTAWVTARFSAASPMPKALWTKWLDESYALSAAGPAKKKAAKKKAARKKAAKKKAATKKRAKKKAAKKAAKKASGTRRR